MGETGEFVVNRATLALARRMNETSRDFPAGIDECAPAGLTPAPCRLVRPPRVAESPAALECVLTEPIDIRDRRGQTGNRRMAIGEVVGVHIDEALRVGGRFDMVRAGTLARGGYWDYQVTTAVFSLPKPDAPDAH